VSWRGTTALFVLLGLLGAAIWWIDHGARRPAEATEAPLLTAPDALTALEVHAADRIHRFERHDGTWPGVAALLDALTTLAPIMIVSDAPSDPMEFGLGPDAVRIVAWHDATPVLDLHVGARNPAWTAVYVRRVDTSRVELVGALLHWELSKLLDRPLGP
jgi:hypothetical protein